MFRKTVLASLIAFGAATGLARAADNAPQLVNRNGSQEIVNEEAGDNIVGGAFATITGGGNNQTYSAAPGARTEDQGLAATLSGGGDNEVVTYAAPPAARAATALRLRPSTGG